MKSLRPTHPWVPVLAKGKTDTGRIWVYVRDDKPFGGPEPPGAVFYYSRDRAGEHPQAHLANYSGIFQADAYGGYTKLYEGGRTVRQQLSAPLVADLETWMREQRAKLSRGNDVAKAMDYMLKRWAAFTRFLDDGRICLSNNAAER